MLRPTLSSEGLFLFMGIDMKRAFAGLALVALAASLSACVYYPNGPEGPGYGPPPPHGYGAPPPGAEYGPPPDQQAPPGYGQEGGAPPQGAYGAPGPSPKQAAKMNDPQWCAAHPHHCAKLQQKYGAPQGGPPPQQGGYGPPPQGGQYGPPPNEQGPPPNEQGPPPQE